MTKNVYSPFLFIGIYLIAVSCNNYESSDVKNSEFLKAKGDEAFYKKAKLDSAYYYYNKLKEATPNDQEIHTFSLLQIATIQQYTADFFGSEETVTEGLTNDKDSIYKPYLYNMLAIAYDKQKKYDDALVFYSKASETFKDSVARAIAENNIGVIYIEKKQYDKALDKLSSLLDNHAVKGSKIETARILDNLGYAKFKLNHPAAFSMLIKSARLRDSLNDNIGGIASNVHLAEYYKNTDKAKAALYASRALSLAQEIKSYDDQLEALRWLIETGGITTSKKYNAQYFRLDDSLSLSRISAKNQFAKIKYDSSKAIHEKEQAETKTRNISLAALAVFIILLLAIYIVRYRNRLKLKASVYDTETRISKRIHDELANDIFNTMTFAETQNLQDPAKKELLLQGMDSIYKRARNISNENSDIIVNELFEDALKEMITGFSNDQIKVIIKDNKEIDWSSVSKLKKVTIYRVLQELMVNMKKYSNCSFVVISFERNREALQISYTDNGIGFPKGFIKKNGLHNVETRIKAIKGTITFETELKKGFKANIII